VTTEELIELQKADETIEKYWDLSKQPSNINKKVSFIEKKENLYRSYGDKRGDEIRLQLVVPERLRKRVLSMAHDTLLGGYRGVAKTQYRVTSEFYWPRIHDDIRRYCWSCDVCQKNVSKGSVGRAHLGQMPLVETPYSTICVNLVGPLSPPSEGHRFILTAIDLCTRFPDEVPLDDIHTSTVAEALIGIFSSVGIPRRIHSDRGSQFTSEMMSEVSRLLSIQQSTTSPYHVMGNGVVENVNKTMKNMLKKVAAERPKDWHQYLIPLMFAVRDTPQDSDGFTPFELLYGRSVRTPMTILKALWTGEVEDQKNVSTYQYVIDLRKTN